MFLGNLLVNTIQKECADKVFFLSRAMILAMISTLEWSDGSLSSKLSPVMLTSKTDGPFLPDSASGSLRNPHFNKNGSVYG